MCGGPEQMHAQAQDGNTEPPFKEKVSKKSLGYGELLKCSSCLLELAASNDINMFQTLAEEGNTKIDDEGLWYVRRNGTSQMGLEQRTPAMIAALYGSMDVLKFILSYYVTNRRDVDRACGNDRATALHCAAAGGSAHAVLVVRLLLKCGARTDVRDSEGRRPADVLIVPFGSSEMKMKLEELLDTASSAGFGPGKDLKLPECFESLGSDPSETSCMKISSPSSPASSLSASSSPKTPHAVMAKEVAAAEDGEKARDRFMETTLPDIKNGFYTSDEFRMYSFKIRPCSRAYSHDWTECPFAHPGENARRRDPRRYHYSCVPCPDFRKGACHQGDACDYAHGVFECWLHPAQYRTRLCKDGADCDRKVCFFAHKADELRPVYASTGSGLPSPVSAAYSDTSCMTPPPLSPCSPSVMPPYSPLHPLHSTLGCSRTPLPPGAALWPQPSIPTLHIPGASLQASRSPAAITTHNVSVNNFDEEQLTDEFHSLMAAHSVSVQARLKAAMAASGNGSASSRRERYKSLGLTVAPANLDELFALENIHSPGSSARDVATLSAQLEQASSQKQLYAHPHGTVRSSPRGSSFTTGSPPFTSLCEAHCVERPGMSRGAPSPASVSARSAAISHGTKGSRSVRDLGAGYLWSDWGSPTGKLEWGMQQDDLLNLRKSVCFQMGGSEEPAADGSWMQKMVKEAGRQSYAASNVYYKDGGRTNVQVGSADRSAAAAAAAADVLGTALWIDNLCVDQIMV